MKKAIKGLLIFMLIGSVLFTLTGCGEKKEDKEDAVEQKQEASVEKEQKQETSVEKVEKAEFSMGEWNNNIYTNNFLGLKFNLPEEWSYSSKEEIAATMNLGTELLNDDQKIAAEMAKLTSAYYMVAQNKNTGDSVTVLSEKQLANTTTEDYISELKTQLSAVQSISYKINETSKEKISGIETDTLSVTGTMYGIDVAQKYYVYKLDDCMVCIIATSTSGETEIDNIMKNFK